MKKSLKNIYVLGAICLFVAILLAAINYFTAPVIKEAEAKSTQESLAVVLPKGTEFSQLEAENLPETVNAVYADKGGSGYAVVLSTASQYSSADMRITVGIDNDGKICGIKLMSYNESKDFGKDYPDTYLGKDSSLDGADLVAGVTYSSTAFHDAMKDAFKAVEICKEANCDD